VGGKTQTSTSQQTTTPVNTAALQNIYGTVANAAATPYTPYGGQLTAGINAQQTAGINTINSGANAAQPYYAQAGQLASSAANPLTSSEIQQFQNPYTQNVVNATQAQLNDLNGQQQESLLGTATQNGALGGDRQAVAQSQLAGQQALNEAPTIANLYANSYTSGLNTAAQQYQQNPLAAASALGSVGSGAENAALAGGSAQLAAGTQQQQTQQAADTAAYQQYQAQQAYPYQSAAYLEQYGLPAALAQGTSASGTQTTPGPSILSQIAGLGIAGAGVYGAATKASADGGRIGYAPGGSVGYINSPFGYIDSSAGYIPTAKPSGSTSLNAPSLRFATQQQTNMQPVTSAISGLPKLSGPAYGGGSALGGDAYGGSSSSPLTGLVGGTGPDSDYGPGYAIGGLVEAIHGIHRAIKRSRGGAVVGATPLETFSAGGGTANSDARSLAWERARRIARGAVGHGPHKFDDGGVASFDDRFAPAADNLFGDMSRNQAIQYLASQNTPTIAPASIPGGEPAPESPVDTSVYTADNPLRINSPDSRPQGNPANMPPGFTAGAPSVVANDVPGPGDNPFVNPASLPRQITNPDNSDDSASSSPLAYNSAPTSGRIGANGLPVVTAPVGQSSADAQPNSSSSSPFGFHLSDNANLGLIATGLGMMASKSPFAGVALGEGGLQGLAAYSNANKADAEAADKKLTHDQEAQRLLLAIEQNKRAAATSPLIQDAKGNWVTNQPLLEEKKAEKELQDDKVKFGTIGYDPSGLPIQGFIDSTNKKLFDASGKEFTPPPGSTSAPAAAAAVANPLTDGVVKANAAQAAVPFDYSRSSPIVEKGLDVPDPAPVAGKSTATLKSDAEMYLQTGKLPPIVARGQSPVAVLQNAYRTAVQNYANAKAASIGQTPEQIVNMWRTAPGMLKFIDGPDGRATVSLGTAVRHLDTLKQYIEAFNANDAPRIRQMQAIISREFGQSAATNIDAASSIVGPEIVKAIGVAGAGTKDERLNAETLFRAGSSQSKDAINVVEHLLAGQLEGKERQARNSGVTPERFKDLIGDRPYDLLKHIDGESSVPPRPSAVPAGSAYSPSRRMWKTPDGTLFNANGQPVR
jgi:hypothetical protein